MSTSTIGTVRVTRRFRVSPERAFDAWLDPKLIEIWMLGSSTTDQIVRVSTDPKVGGKFSFVIHRAGEELDHTGEYKTVDRPHRLSFTWGVLKYSKNLALITVDFATHGAETDVTLTCERVLPEYIQRTELGWGKILDAIAMASRSHSSE